MICILNILLMCRKASLLLNIFKAESIHNTYSARGLPKYVYVMHDSNIYLRTCFCFCALIQYTSVYVMCEVKCLKS